MLVDAFNEQNNTVTVQANTDEEVIKYYIIAI